MYIKIEKLLFTHMLVVVVIVVLLLALSASAVPFVFAGTNV